MFQEGQWVCGVYGEDSGKLGWTYPGKITHINSHCIVFEIQDIGGSYEAYRTHDALRHATKADFDRQVLDISKEILNAETVISLLEEVQKNVKT